MSDDNQDSESEHPHLPFIPPDSPKELKTLAANVSEVLDAIKARKTREISAEFAEEYDTILLSLLTLLQQNKQIEQIACEASRFIIQVAKDTDSPNLASSAQEHHNIMHKLADTSDNRVHTIIAWFNMQEKFIGISQDMVTLLKRFKSDWYDKGHS